MTQRLSLSPSPSKPFPINIELVAD